MQCVHIIDNVKLKNWKESIVWVDIYSSVSKASREVANLTEKNLHTQAHGVQ